MEPCKKLCTGNIGAFWNDREMEIESNLLHEMDVKVSFPQAWFSDSYVLHSCNKIDQFHCGHQMTMIHKIS